MEVVLLIIAGVVLYMLYNGFQDYLKNPYKRENSSNTFNAEYKPSDNPYIEMTSADRIKKTEFGILAGLLSVMAASDGKICKLEQELIKNLLDDIAKELEDYKDAREALQSIFDENKDDLDSLARAFEEATKGEYKKRLKVVEFLFALAYADGKLDEVEREKIIDIAALFELNNDDFNKLYDEFEEKYSSGIEMTKSRALELFELGEDFSKEDLESAYSKKIKDNKQNILLNKNINKSFKDSPYDTLREIDCAYKLLSSSLDSATQS